MICFRDGSPPLPDVLNSSIVELGKSDANYYCLSHGPLCFYFLVPSEFLITVLYLQFSNANVICTTLLFFYFWPESIVNLVHPCSISILQKNQIMTKRDLNVAMLGPLSNASFEGLKGQNVQCYPMQKNILVELTNEQVNFFQP